MSSDEDDSDTAPRRNNGRFQKGVSGNPKGRPPNKRRLEGPGQLARDAINLAGQMVEVNGAQGKRKISKGEVLVEAIYANAIRGKAAAQRTMLNLLEDGYAARLKQHPILALAEVFRQMHEDPTGTPDPAILSAVDEWVRRLKKL